eukprot:1147499-Pelagomonas_calceolata.AAC.5
MAQALAHTYPPHPPACACPCSMTMQNAPAEGSQKSPQSASHQAVCPCARAAGSGTAYGFQRQSDHRGQGSHPCASGAR